MDKNNFKKILSEKLIILDGATGTELQRRGYLEELCAPEELNLKHPERIREIHEDYFKAGADAVLANTFGANRLKLKNFGLENKLEEIILKGVENARKVSENFNGLVIGDIGPIGAYLKPLGPLSFDDAYEIFSEQAKALSKAKSDIICIETFAEIREMKAAILAVKDNFQGPVIAQMTFNSDGKTVTGTDIMVFVSVAESMGVDAIGLNCSVGPGELAKLSKILAKNTNLPVSFKPNAGMPKLINRETVFPGTPDDFTRACIEAYKTGAGLLGGCCGTTPEFIKELSLKLKNKKPVQKKTGEKLLLSSRTKAINIKEFKKLALIGERINPTGRKRFQEELSHDNFSTIRKEAKQQADSGADILDLNLGLPGADEKSLMAKSIFEIQETVSSPLCLDSSSAAVLEEGLKTCAGRPIINSVNGEEKSLEKIIPLASRYGAALIALSTDEKGLPQNCEERISIAKKIYEKAAEAGLKESDIIFDFLVIAVSASQNQARETLKAIKEARKLWPRASFSLGISNISFGMPNRQALNSTFLKLAKEAGINFAIINPLEKWDIFDKAAENLLMGRDDAAKKYIAKHSKFVKKSQPELKKESIAADKRLFYSIIEGSREEIPEFTRETLKVGFDPTAISNEIILKALNVVGEKFKNGEYFLPQVIRSAEAATAAFAILKPLIKKDAKASNKRIILATVKGDFHDIGKNIVAAVLESYGWDVLDLGKNVDELKIIETAKRENIKLIGLSALMTTTMIEMEKVINEKNTRKLDAKIMIGGAPVTEKFARQIGADGYSRDAVEAAKLAEKLLNN